MRLVLALLAVVRLDFASSHISHRRVRCKEDPLSPCGPDGFVKTPRRIKRQQKEKLQLVEDELALLKLKEKHMSFGLGRSISDRRVERKFSSAVQLPHSADEKEHLEHQLNAEHRAPLRSFTYDKSSHAAHLSHVANQKHHSEHQSETKHRVGARRFTQLKPSSKLTPCAEDPLSPCGHDGFVVHPTPMPTLPAIAQAAEKAAAVAAAGMPPRFRAALMKAAAEAALRKARRKSTGTRRPTSSTATLSPSLTSTTNPFSSSHSMAPFMQQAVAPLRGNPTTSLAPVLPQAKHTLHFQHSSVALTSLEHRTGNHMDQAHATTSDPKIATLASTRHFPHNSAALARVEQRLAGAKQHVNKQKRRIDLHSHKMHKLHEGAHSTASMKISVPTLQPNGKPAPVRQHETLLQKFESKLGGGPGGGGTWTLETVKTSPIVASAYQKHVKRTVQMRERLQQLLHHQALLQARQARKASVPTPRPSPDFVNPFQPADVSAAAQRQRADAIAQRKADKRAKLRVQIQAEHAIKAAPAPLHFPSMPTPSPTTTSPSPAFANGGSVKDCVRHPINCWFHVSPEDGSQDYWASFYSGRRSHQKPFGLSLPGSIEVQVRSLPPTPAPSPYPTDASGHRIFVNPFQTHTLTTPVPKPLHRTLMPTQTPSPLPNAFLLSPGGGIIDEAGISVVRPSMAPSPSPTPPLKMARDSRPQTMRPHIFEPRATQAPKMLANLPSYGHARSISGRGEPRLCGATSPGPTNWRRFGTRGGLYAVIDISYCNFDAAAVVEGKLPPRITASLRGGGRQWGVTGINGIGRISAKSFTAYVVPLAYGYSARTSRELLGAAKRLRWRVSWLAAVGFQSGITIARGATMWGSHLTDAAAKSASMATEKKERMWALKDAYEQPVPVLSLCVDTRQPQDAETTPISTDAGQNNAELVPFRSVPMYFVSLVDDVTGVIGLHANARLGSLGLTRVSGQHVVHSSTEHSFQLFVTPSRAMSPKAASARWRVSWLALYPDSVIVRGGKVKLGLNNSQVAAMRSSGNVLGRAAKDCAECRGVHRDWASSSDNTAIVWDVDASVQEFPVVPAFVSSVAIPSDASIGRFDSPLWVPTGAAATDQPTPTGFRLFLRSSGAVDDTRAREQAGLFLAAAKLFSWSVQYVGFEGPIACVVSPWGTYSACSKPCMGGVRHRNRTILQTPYHGGEACPTLTSFMLCNTGPCIAHAVDCSVSEWSLWNATASWSTGGSAAVAAAEAENQAVPTTEGQALKRIEAAQRQAGKVGNVHVPVVYLDSDGHACSAECGGGMQFRNRTITRKAKHGGRACPSLSQQRSCNTAPCTKRNCTVGPWNNASTAECSRSCGRGRKTRSRSVLWQARGGGKPCPPLYLVEDCNVWSCPQNCVVSQWSAWKPACDGYGYGDDGRCAPRQQSRLRVVSQFNSDGGRRCPLTHQERECGVAHGRPCVGSAAMWRWNKKLGNVTQQKAKIPVDGRICGGVTPATAMWRTLHADSLGRAIMLEVSTAECDFDTMPQYAISLQRLQSDPMWQHLAGSATVLQPKADSFTVALFHPKIEAAKLLEASVAFNWGVSWIGDFGRHSGITISGASGWQQDPTSMNTLFLDVNAKQCLFSATDDPKWFPSLHTDTDIEDPPDKTRVAAWRATGANSVFRSHAGGFRVYVKYFVPITPRDAENAGWTIGWLSAAASSTITGTRYATWTATAGSSLLLDGGITAHNSEFNSRIGSLTAHTDITVSKFEVAPAIVASLVPHPGMSGSMVSSAVSLGHVTPQGFNIHLAATRLDGFGADISYIGFSRVDCSLSPWSSWSACDVECGGGRQSRTRRLLRKPRGGGTLCQVGAQHPVPPDQVKYRETRVCRMKGCVGQGATHYCGNTVQVQWFGNVTTWKLHGTNSIRAKVDTAWCQYKHAPSYVASVTAPGTTWQLAGTHSIMEPTARDFVVQLYHRGLRGAALLKAATTQQWGLSWIADGGHQSGRTAKGATSWQPFSQATTASNGRRTPILDPAPGLAFILFADVNTEPNHYVSDPQYFVSLYGDTAAWLTHGAHIIHRPSRRGFRIYIVSMRRIDPKEANRRGWCLAWIGTTHIQGNRAGTQSQGWRYGSQRSLSSLTYLGAEGRSTFGDTAQAFWSMQVDTGAAMYSSTPTYISSITAHGGVNAFLLMWLAMGAANIFNPSPTGFKIYLEGAPNLHFGGQDHWAVNYFGFERKACPTSKWGEWTPCPCSNAITLSALARARPDAAIQLHTQRYRKSLKAPKRIVCTPVQLQETRSCSCGTAPPTPIPTTLTPTKAPTPMIADTVAVVRIAGVASANLRTIKVHGSKALRSSQLLQLRKAFADALTVPLQTVFITHIEEDMALEKSAEAQITGHVVPGTVVTVRITAANAADAEDAATTLVAPPFADLLSEKMIDRGFNGVQPGGGAIRVARPVVHIAQRTHSVATLHNAIDEKKPRKADVSPHLRPKRNGESNVALSPTHPSTLWSYVAPFGKALTAGVAFACIAILCFVAARRCSLRLKRAPPSQPRSNESAPLNYSISGRSLTLAPTEHSAYRVNWSTARERTPFEDKRTLSDHRSGTNVALQMRALRAREVVRSRSATARGSVDKPRIELDADGAALV